MVAELDEKLSSSTDTKSNICDEPLITVSASNLSFTSASVYPTLEVFATISSNFAFVNTPALLVDADANVALLPSLEFTSTVVSVVVPSDKLVDTLWLTSVDLAVFAAISSNKVGDNKPDTLVVAIGITALLPSEETIVLAPVVPVILKSVDTLVTLSLLSEILLISVELIVLVFPASAVELVLPNVNKVGKFDISEE